MLEKIKEAADYIRSIISDAPIDFAIILGSGLGKLQDEVQSPIIIPYKDIPNFPQTTVEGHKGNLIFGKIGEKTVLMMSGRFHYYEGYSMQEVTFPVRVFGVLGIKNIVVSNASGGVNSDYKVGDIMMIRDHINFFPAHPLRGKNIDSLGPRFPDMSQAYDRGFLKIAIEEADKYNIYYNTGVYLGIQGPTFETPSEYNMIKILGADAVGMSTVPEVIVARHQSMRVFAISIITDVGGKDLEIPVSHEEVLAAANNAMPNVIQLVKAVISKG